MVIKKNEFDFKKNNTFIDLFYCPYLKYLQGSTFVKTSINKSILKLIILLFLSTSECEGLLTRRLTRVEDVTNSL